MQGPISIISDTTEASVSSEASACGFLSGGLADGGLFGGLSGGVLRTSTPAPSEMFANLDVKQTLIDALNANAALESKLAVSAP